MNHADLLGAFGIGLVRRAGEQMQPVLKLLGTRMRHRFRALEETAHRSFRRNNLVEAFQRNRTSPAHNARNGRERL